ncbi:terpene synthase family protein [Aspergillus melleus]|uniref:terpene synthase family protein n=1 Tax=Aspergillus melleus TaxID=138277 RepID=UPI001E8E8CAF|nr:uncharacterized protein LDX57_011623 [Aspergillus melleus]KAH8433987.1 hypothetical protein LDX57_011623 [Aspergillus melleus]
MEPFPVETTLAVDPILYKRDEQFLSQFKPRIYKDPKTCDDACIQAQLDLLGAEHQGEVIKSLHLTVGCLPALAFSFCKPDRMPLLSYLVEVSLLQDDLGNLDPTENWKVADARIQTRHNTQYETISEYMRDRSEDFGWKFVTALVQFATQIELTSEEDATLAPIHSTLCAALSLYNDYYSWEKEYEAFTRSNGQVACLNGVYVYMNSEAISAKAALQATAKKAIELENEYRGLRDTLGSCSPSVVCWLDALEALTAGTMLWSISCPRYLGFDGEGNLYRSYYKDRLEAGVRFSDDDAGSASAVSTDHLGDSLGGFGDSSS